MNFDTNGELDFFGRKLVVLKTHQGSSNMIHAVLQAISTDYHNYPSTRQADVDLVKPLRKAVGENLTKDNKLFINENDVKAYLRATNGGEGYETISREVNASLTPKQREHKKYRALFRFMNETRMFGALNVETEEEHYLGEKSLLLLLEASRENERGTPRRDNQAWQRYLDFREFKNMDQFRGERQYSYEELFDRLIYPHVRSPLSDDDYRRLYNLLNYEGAFDARGDAGLKDVDGFEDISLKSYFCSIAEGYLVSSMIMNPDDDMFGLDNIINLSKSNDDLTDTFLYLLAAMLNVNVYLISSGDERASRFPSNTADASSIFLYTTYDNDNRVSYQNLAHQEGSNYYRLMFSRDHEVLKHVKKNTVVNFSPGEVMEMLGLQHGSDRRYPPFTNYDISRCLVVEGYRPPESTTELSICERLRRRALGRNP
jgi:hypothetical protein